MTDDQQHAIQEQRRREADAVEIAALREYEARARWCEENKADVSWSDCSRRWRVIWRTRLFFDIATDPDRNAAIDAAMKGRQ